MIVDPSSGDIVARACTNVAHPLQHAVMQCIDKVAMQQGGGAWRGDPPVASLLQNSPNRHTVGEPCDSAIRQTSAVVGKCDAMPVKKRKVESYLCTGYDLFTTHEPCIMYSLTFSHCF